MYVHVPFCRDRCTYCAFPTILDRERDHVPVIDGILRELARCRPVGPLKTLYLGGGTPSLVAPRLLSRIVRAAREKFGLLPSAEITLETNPGQVTHSALASWADLGITRLSVGIQTFDDALLRQLGLSLMIKSNGFE